MSCLVVEWGKSIEHRLSGRGNYNNNNYMLLKNTSIWARFY